MSLSSHRPRCRLTATVTEFVDSGSIATVRLTITGGWVEISASVQESPHLGDEIEFEGEIHGDVTPGLSPLFARRRSPGGPTHLG